MTLSDDFLTVYKVARQFESTSLRHAVASFRESPLSCAEMLAHDVYPNLAQAVLETVQLGMACITRSVESAKTAEAAERSFETEDRPRWRFCLEQDLHLLDAMYSAAIEAALRAAEPS